MRTRLRQREDPSPGETARATNTRHRSRHLRRPHDAQPSRAAATWVVAALALAGAALFAPDNAAGTAIRVALLIAGSAAPAWAGQRYVVRSGSRAVGVAASTAVVLLWLLIAGAVIVASPLPLSRAVACVAVTLPTIVYLMGAALTLRTASQPEPAPRSTSPAPDREGTSGAATWAVTAVLMAGAVALSAWSQHHSEPGFIALSASRRPAPDAGPNARFVVTYRRSGTVAGAFELQLGNRRHLLGRFPIPASAETWSIKVRVKKGLTVDCRLVQADAPHRTVRAIELG